ncbi:UNVERIFIED_CONTAM: hypothetical protein PYX00_006965 [Menopon gallinae]|uniref:Uncharacterized protein n=1 Tax=Menopon gallinae TaxID=328185 RepID=A0AAW2HH10_9NEOP
MSRIFPKDNPWSCALTRAAFHHCYKAHQCILFPKTCVISTELFSLNSCSEIEQFENDIGISGLKHGSATISFEYTIGLLRVNTLLHVDSHAVIDTAPTILSVIRYKTRQDTRCDGTIGRSNELQYAHLDRLLRPLSRSY